MSSSSRVIKLARLSNEVRVIPVAEGAGSPPVLPDPGAGAPQTAPPEAILTEARAEAEVIRSEAYRVGFEAGLADGRRAAEAEAAGYLGRLRAFVDAARLEHRRILREAEEQLLTLALAAAERVLSRKLEESDRKLIADFIAEALQEVENALGSPEAVVVRVNPQDSDFASLVLAARDTKLLADPRVEAGGCVVETSAAVIDSTPTERLRQIARLFRQAHELEHRP